MNALNWVGRKRTMDGVPVQRCKARGGRKSNAQSKGELGKTKVWGRNTIIKEFEAGGRGREIKKT